MGVKAATARRPWHVRNLARTLNARGYPPKMSAAPAPDSPEAGKVSLPSGRASSGPSAGVRLMVAAVVGLAAGATVTVVGGWRFGLLAGWMLAAAVFVGWVWATIARMDATATARHAVRENAGRKTMDFVVVVASVASLGAVALFLSGGSGGKDTQALLSVGAVALAWGSVHTLFTTRYARMYYVDHAGGIDFNEKEAPTYLDFAYLAFTIGMTFQVSDTDLTRKSIRATALRHALLSYLFGAVIVATTINLIAGLGK